jgi:hypothetical protein
VPFFEDDQLAELTIDRMVFHLVGPKEGDFVRLEAIDPGEFSAFFLDRIRSVVNGAPYSFSDASSTRERLCRIAADPSLFQEESERLADDFQRQHGGTTSAGAVLLFSLRAAEAQFFAILKYDDEIVLSYDFEQLEGGRNRVTLAALERTFVQNRQALQKSAIIELAEEGGRLTVLDRRNPQRVARYFENFLDAVRLHEDADLTEKLVNATKETIRRNRALVPVAAASEVAKRCYEAARAGGAVDVDGHRGFLETVVGQRLPDDHPILPKFAAELRRARIDGVPMTLDAAKVRPPTTKRLVTVHNIQIRVPIDMVDIVEEREDQIVIHDRVEARFDDADRTG